MTYSLNLGFLDNPSINWKTVIVSFTLGQYIFESFLGYKQYQVLKRTAVPHSLKAEITQETYDKSQEYSRAKEGFSFFTSAYSLIKNLLYIKYDLLPKFWVFSGAVLSHLLPVLPKFMGGVITQSIIFLFANSLFSELTSIPVDYYKTFVLEEKYGFNKSTLSLWAADFFKSLLIQMVLLPPFLGSFLKIIEWYGQSFVLYACGLVLFFQLFFMTIFPSLIQPLFNKFTPLEDGELKTAIEDLAKKQGFPLTKLYVIDGSKRSGHSNAYFTGLPWSKQIVLFDTLIEHSTVDETVAVLAHEIGHWKLNHLPRMLAFSQVNMMVMFSMFAAFLGNNSLFQSFGFFGLKPTIVALLLFSDIFKPLESGLQFLQNLLVRKHEYEADEYAKSCGYTDDLGKSLIKLNIENLSYVEADPLYSAYYRSHPILSERLNAIGYISKEKVSMEKDTKSD
ncbi:hypothetical protein CANTEDRAFT_116932 [Yamadazyma tenuis ATCC 10573]|uniref:CAAX prenyl protease n=1 Tax=Candida tenuis (strain ATCC 10573 / BCRC 21748 / CBS 615 / JCM 9827 / NBRC 10315 / NRRL Y-1498 / VKM Y-70) TaxID=590646 RepID=G3BCT2_CANTC|nr:uncharacterized protein CANTEDRAFT_116932 [Yamadazyma tenuis ATCC 10573]EGV61287.1 hypothetical protein CANTEDRAFT_116932 [Yamadazyma tenuis ATCC 10573]